MVPSHGAELRDQRGFTLIELMIVVAVIAILAAVVVPTFFRESNKTRSTTEVTPMFTELGIRQGQHKTETGVYLAAAACPGTFTGTSYASTDCSGTTEWTALHVAPVQTQLKCEYTMVVGTGGESPVVPTGFTFAAPATQSWYYLYARCDGDSQGASSTNAEYFTSSMDSTIQKRNEAN